MFNVAHKSLLYIVGGALVEHPVSVVQYLAEQNVRDRILTREEFARMLETSPGYLKNATRAEKARGRPTLAACIREGV